MDDFIALTSSEGSPRFGGSASLGAALDAATLCGLSQRPAGALAMALAYA